MFKAINPLIKLALFSCSSYFICQAIYILMTMLVLASRGYHASSSFAVFNISNVLTNGLLNAIMVAILLVIFLNKHQANQATTKNIVTTIGITVVIFIIKTLIEFGYNIGLTSIIRMLREQKDYSYNMISSIVSLVYPIKVIIFSILLIGLSYFSTLVAVNANWFNSEQEQLTTSFAPNIIAIGYSLILAVIMSLLSTPMTQETGYIILHTTNSYSLVAISLILTMVIVSILHFFFIYSWTISASKNASRLNSPALIKAILLSLACFLTAFVLVVIGTAIALKSRIFFQLIDSDIITLLAILTTIGVWWSLISIVNTSLFTVLSSGFFILNFLFVTFTALNNTNAHITTVISCYMLSTSIGLLILFCCTYFPVKSAFK